MDLTLHAEFMYRYRRGMRRAVELVFPLLENVHNIYNVSTTVYIKSGTFIIFKIVT